MILKNQEADKLNANVQTKYYLAWLFRYAKIKKMEYCFLTNKKLFSIKLILINQVHGKTKKKNDSGEVIQRCSVKNGVLKNEACNFIKKSLWHKVFSCEFCEIFKNNYFYRTPLGGYFWWLLTFLLFFTQTYFWYPTMPLNFSETTLRIFINFMTFKSSRPKVFCKKGS